MTKFIWKNLNVISRNEKVTIQIENDVRVNSGWDITEEGTNGVLKLKKLPRVYHEEKKMKNMKGI